MKKLIILGILYSLFTFDAFAQSVEPLESLFSSLVKYIGLTDEQIRINNPDVSRIKNTLIYKNNNTNEQRWVFDDKNNCVNISFVFWDKNARNVYNNYVREAESIYELLHFENVVGFAQSFWQTNIDNLVLDISYRDPMGGPNITVSIMTNDYYMSLQ
jgi:hypothetical protein